MLPRQVLTHLNGAQLAARLPEPVAIGKCWQPAFSAAGQQDRPSLTTLLPAAKSRSASRSTSFLRKPLTTLSRSRLGRGLDRGDDRRLACGTAAALAARALAAEV